MGNVRLNQYALTWLKTFFQSGIANFDKNQALTEPQVKG
jgi:hypothetical protein